MRIAPGLLALGAAAAPALAGDHSSLETFFPLIVEGAYTAGRHEVEVQISTRFGRLRGDSDGRNVVEIVPRLE